MKIIDIKDFKKDFDAIVKIAEKEEIMIVNKGKILFSTFPYELVKTNDNDPK